MPQRYLKLGNRWVCIVAFPEGICIQEVYPKLGKELCYPYEPWMEKLTKPSLYQSI